MDISHVCHLSEKEMFILWFFSIFQESLNSNDDVSDEESAEVFETDNVVVCQFDKVSSKKSIKKRCVYRTAKGPV